MESADDRKIFLDDMGLDEPGVNKLIKAAYRLLNFPNLFYRWRSRSTSMDNSYWRPCPASCSSYSYRF
jgi:hypothetical protein